MFDYATTLRLLEVGGVKAEDYSSSFLVLLSDAARIEKDKISPANKYLEICDRILLAAKLGESECRFPIKGEDLDKLSSHGYLRRLEDRGLEYSSYSPSGGRGVMQLIIRWYVD